MFLALCFWYWALYVLASKVLTQDVDIKSRVAFAFAVVLFSLVQSIVEPTTIGFIKGRRSSEKKHADVRRGDLLAMFFVAHFAFGFLANMALSAGLPNFYMSWISAFVHALLSAIPSVWVASTELHDCNECNITYERTVGGHFKTTRHKHYIVRYRRDDDSDWAPDGSSSRFFRRPSEGDDNGYYVNVIIPKGKRAAFMKSYCKFLIEEGTVDDEPLSGIVASDDD